MREGVAGASGGGDMRRLLRFFSNGLSETAIVTWDHQIPTPGALSLLGIAGLLGLGRRHR